MVDPLWGAVVFVLVLVWLLLVFFSASLMESWIPDRDQGGYLSFFLARAKPGMATSVSWHGVFCTNYLLAVKIEGRAS